MPYAKTVILRRTIQQVADDPERVAQLEQFFLGSSAKPNSKGRGAPGYRRARPPEFWRQASEIAARVADQIEMSKGECAYIVTKDGPGAGGISACSASLALQRLSQNTHRLATREEIAEHKRAGKPAPTGEA